MHLGLFIVGTYFLFACAFFVFLAIALAENDE